MTIIVSTPFPPDACIACHPELFAHFRQAEIDLTDNGEEFRMTCCVKDVSSCL